MHANKIRSVMSFATWRSRAVPLQPHHFLPVFSPHSFLPIHRFPIPPPCLLLSSTSLSQTPPVFRWWWRIMTCHISSIVCMRMRLLPASSTPPPPSLHVDYPPSFCQFFILWRSFPARSRADCLDVLCNCAERSGADIQCVKSTCSKTVADFKSQSSVVPLSWVHGAY